MGLLCYRISMECLEYSLRKAQRTARILHLQNQNTIGASLVENFMNSNVAFKQGLPLEDADVTATVEKASYSYQTSLLSQYVYLKCFLHRVRSKEKSTLFGRCHEI